MNPACGLGDDDDRVDDIDVAELEYSSLAFRLLLSGNKNFQIIGVLID